MWIKWLLSILGRWLKLHGKVYKIHPSLKSTTEFKFSKYFGNIKHTHITDTYTHTHNYLGKSAWYVKWSWVPDHIIGQVYF